MGQAAKGRHPVSGRAKVGSGPTEGRGAVRLPPPRPPGWVTLTYDYRGWLEITCSRCKGIAFAAVRLGAKEFERMIRLHRGPRCKPPYMVEHRT